MSSNTDTNGYSYTNGTAAKRPVRIAGASGGIYDRKRAIHDLAKNEDVDFITGDWMSEANMTLRGSDKWGEKSQTILNRGYEPYFLEQLEPAIPYLAKNSIKLCVNAGASDVEGLAMAVRVLVKNAGVDLQVGYVDGDDVTETFFDLYKKGEKFTSLTMGKDLKDWGFDPVCAQCYLGGSGIAAVFAGGADIVICGRVADASVTAGAAMFWHGWDRSNLKGLAGALMIGHLLECSTYVAGGYYSGFKDLGVHDTDMGYPIAAIDHTGAAILSIEKGRNGLMTIGTVTSQLVYEIQGPIYFNSDVTAEISDIKIERVGENQVKVSGVKVRLARRLPPSVSTKIGITARGGYQAEFHFYLTGLDIPEKAAMIKRQTLRTMGDNVKKFSCLNFTIAGSVPEDPQSQDEATVDLRIFAQSREPDILAANAPMDSDRGCFARYCLDNLLQGYPGSTMAIDMRQAVGKPFFEYWVALMPQSAVKEIAHLPDGSSINIGSPPVTKEYPRGEQHSADTVDPVDISQFGETTRAPLGYIVMGRSGDKSSNCNVGFFVRHDDEWDWLRSLLSVEMLKKLLGKDYKGGRIERCEFPYVRSVHFHLIDYLDRGYNSTSGYDILGKNLCEYLRAKYVDIPNKFLERGRI